MIYGLLIEVITSYFLKKKFKDEIVSEITKEFVCIIKKRETIVYCFSSLILQEFS